MRAVPGSSGTSEPDANKLRGHAFALEYGRDVAMSHVKNESQRGGDLITEDDRARNELGPQGVPERPDTHPTPPRGEKDQMPKDGEFDGHPA